MASGAHTPSDGEWSEFRARTPQYRYGAAGVYDSRRRRMIVYAGYELFELRGDLWALDVAGNGAWTHLQTTGPAPIPRVYPGLVYDDVADRLILFGGYDRWDALGDCWELSLTGPPRWKQITVPPDGPAPRYGHALLFDHEKNRVLVHGGASGLTVYGDLWELSLTDEAPRWRMLSDPDVPESFLPREFHAMALDPTERQLVLFGGRYQGALRNDVWTLPIDRDGVQPWSLETTSGSLPSTRHGHQLVFDGKRRRMLLQGGIDEEAPGAAWSLGLDRPFHWTQLPTRGADIGSRFLHDLVLDPVGDRLVLFGGELGSGPHGSPSFLDLGSNVWSTGSPPEPNPGGYGYSAVPDLVHRRALWITAFGSAWELALDATPRWSPVETLDAPFGWRYGFSVAADAKARRALLWSGYESYPAQDYKNDVWSLSFDGAPRWSLVTDDPAGPRGRESGCAVWDSRRNRLIVFGGTFDYSSYFNDLWALPLDTPPGRWVPLLAEGDLPIPRAEAAMFYDASRDRLLLFGGYEEGHFHNDLWSLDLSGDPLRWREETPEGRLPSWRGAMPVAYDAGRDRLLFFSGRDYSTAPGDVWALSLAGSMRWDELAPAGPSPRGRIGGQLVYDPALDRALLWGGGYHDLWQLQWDPSTPPLEVSTRPGSGRLALAGALRNPTRGPIEVAFTLPDAAPARLELFDVRGRRIEAYEVGHLGAGSHTVALDGSTAAPGVFFLALVRGTESRYAKAVRIR